MTKTRVCIISNSHAACLKGGIPAVEAELDCTFTVFAVPTTGMKHVEADMDAGALVPQTAGVKQFFATTSGGIENIIVADYDAFIVHGLFMTPPRLDTRHSAAFRRAAAVDVMENSQGQRVALMLRDLTKAPIIMSAEPLVADFEEDEITKVRPTSNVPKSPVTPQDIWDSLAENCAVDDVQWITQNPTTIGTLLNTKRRYCEGSTRLDWNEDRAHKDKDIRHMNSEYGEMVLRAAVAKLRALG